MPFLQLYTCGFYDFTAIMVGNNWPDVFYPRKICLHYRSNITHVFAGRRIHSSISYISIITLGTSHEIKNQKISSKHQIINSQLSNPLSKKYNLEGSTWKVHLHSIVLHMLTININECYFYIFNYWEVSWIPLVGKLIKL